MVQNTECKFPGQELYMYSAIAVILKEVQKKEEKT